MVMMSLSLRWTCSRDKVLLLIKFGLKKKIYLKNDNDEFEFKMDLL